MAANSGLPFSRPPTPKMPPSQVGFIGLGNIGYLMALNLANCGPIHIKDFLPLLVWNRTACKAGKLVNDVGVNKARIAKKPEDIMQECDIIIINLSNDDVVRCMYQRLIATLKNSPPIQDEILVETSTIYPSLAAELDLMVSSLPNSHLVTCPVLGTPIIADKLQLLLVMSGNYRARREIAYLLVLAAGRKVVDLGEDLEKAPIFKLMANSMILGNLEILAEAFTFTEKSGIGAQNVRDLLSNYFPAPTFVSYPILACADKMLHEQFDGEKGFSIDGGIKDALHIRRLTAKHNYPMPAIDVAHQHLLTTRAIHTRHKSEDKATFDVLDWSSIIAGTRAAAGLDGLDGRKVSELLSESLEHNL
ncbi:hypothetical protein BDQ12DRAFT_645179 [Crucibulum laeve]|uniref:6-phosphogluconate dehydrogenase NADP-binding domain-containing protein n=1 Tax=Crucibulum laeve TaxID=68775 RepID=A0A5C3ML62_9AGAR|nr:hypothetical protein BDQ12DRAFT_645179 [Crucibulum laeve]